MTWYVRRSSCGVQMLSEACCVLSLLCASVSVHCNISVKFKGRCWTKITPREWKDLDVRPIWQMLVIKMAGFCDVCACEELPDNSTQLQSRTIGLSPCVATCLSDVISKTVKEAGRPIGLLSLLLDTKDSLLVKLNKRK